MSLLRVASDVGGTFTDSIAYDAKTRRITVSKVPTTPANRARGTVSGLKRALALQDRTGAEVDYVGHGMTTTTNAVIQRTGARTAPARQQGLPRPAADRPAEPGPACSTSTWSARRRWCHASCASPWPAAWTPPGRRYARSTSKRWKASPPPCARRAWKQWPSCSSIPTPTPLTRCRPRQSWNGYCQAWWSAPRPKWVSEFREYERGSTAVLNAYLRPVMENYLSSLAAMLRDAQDGLGLRDDKPIMVIDAAGGLMTIDGARAMPVHTVLSGPGWGRGRQRACGHLGGGCLTSSPWTSAAPARTSHLYAAAARR